MHIGLSHVLASTILGIIGLSSGCGETSETTLDESRVEQASSSSATSSGTTPGSRDIVIDQLVPSQVALSEFAIVGEEIDIGAHAKVLTRHGEFAVVGNIGPGTTTLRAHTQTGSIVSVGPISSHEGVHVHGSVQTASTVTRDGLVADGGVLEHQIIPTRHLVRRVRFEVQAVLIALGPGESLSSPIRPGYYDELRLGPRASVTLTAGDYYFDRVDIGKDAKLTIDNTGGAVFVYVGRDFEFAGRILPVNADFPRWLVSYAGTGRARFHAPFKGSILAPNGELVLEGANGEQYEGSFFGKKIRVGPNMSVIRREFPLLIRTVSFDKSPVCSGDTVRITVTADDPAHPGVAPTLTIDGMPVGEIFDQVEGQPGKHIYAVSATTADGTHEGMLASLDIVSCSSIQPKVPRLFAAPNLFSPDTVDLIVVNASDFEDGTESFEWDFGDGSPLVPGGPAAISHSFAGATPIESSFEPFNVRVTVKRPGIADATTKRTFVVWSTYALSRERGVLEPPAVPVDPFLKVEGAEFIGQVQFSNVEPEALTLSRRRVDRSPCDPEAPLSQGAEDEVVSINLPARGSVTSEVRILSSSLPPSMCGIVVHYWGTTPSGKKAQTTVHFDRRSAPRGGAPVDASMAGLLNFVVDNGLVANPLRVSEEEVARLYRERKIPSNATSPRLFARAMEPARFPCNPEDPSDPDPQFMSPGPGFACQPTGRWEGMGDNETPLKQHIQNAQKGDVILVRGCSGAVGPLVGAVDPPQIYTHMGIMTKNRFEVTQSTGDEGYLQRFPNGVLGQPSNGFREAALRYGWPGSVTVSVREGFVTGRMLDSPAGGEPFRVKGFIPTQVRCPGDGQVVFPRVLKPAPELDAQVRTRLRAAADIAKGIRGHYRFSDYSDARNPFDPFGPLPFAGPTFGPTRTVCSSFIRQALLGAGFTLDRDTNFPKPSDIRGGTPDGLYFYDAAERKDSANILYAYLHNLVLAQIAGLNTIDDKWWIGVAELSQGVAIVGEAIFSAALSATGVIVNWATDAADDVANQVTNCFAFDFCAEDAKDSDRWQEPGTGIAVAPDDIWNHYDSPVTGGPYGYSEQMVFRGIEFRPIYEWRPSEGSIPVSVIVVSQEGGPIPFAQVTIPGFTDCDKQPQPCPPLTDGNGRALIEGVPPGNISVHAQKVIGRLQEASACFIPASTQDANLLLVDCNFNHVLDPTPVSEVRLVLGPPPEDHRQVIISGSITLEDCDCFVSNDFANRSIFKTCLVSPLERDQDVGLSQTDLCADEIGVRFSAHCTLLPDDRTVRVTGTFALYEDISNSCGGNDLEDQNTFTVDVPAGGTQQPFINGLSNFDVCPFPLRDCTDRAQVSEFAIRNYRAD